MPLILMGKNKLFKQLNKYEIESMEIKGGVKNEFK